MTKISRRSALKSTGLLGAAAAVGCSTSPTVSGDAGVDVTDSGDAAVAVRRVPLVQGDGIFEHGVASGDPTTQSVILWTRVSQQQGTATVSYRVATDPTMTNMVTEGTAETGSDRDHTVLVDVLNLSAGTTYYYQFSLGGQSSPIGRTRTLPTDTSRIRLGVVSCASLAHGYFHVYAKLAARADLDAIIHLGDYIYEYANRAYGIFGDYDPPTECLTLSDYRRRYAYYHLDRDLQELHRQHPIICTWDDHEVANDSWSGGAENHNLDEGPFAARKAAATQAQREWLPIRSNNGNLYRKFQFGNLADLIILDTRHDGRSKPPLTNTDPQPASCECLDRNSPDRRLLSDAQWDFVESSLRDSTATFKLLGQQVIVNSSEPAFFNNDAWDGYPLERQRLLNFLANESIANTVILTGDVHTSWAFDTPRDPALYNPATGEGSVAVELVAPGVSSPGLTAGISAVAAPFLAQVNNLKFFELTQRGYVVVDVQPEQIEAAWYFVGDVGRIDDREDRLAKVFEVRAGTAPHLVEVTATRSAPTGPALAP